jgi:hypothetical protein
MVTDSGGGYEMRLSEVLAKEAGATIRAAIKGWPQTLRLVSLLMAATGPITLSLLLAGVIGR